MQHPAEEVLEVLRDLGLVREAQWLSLHHLEELVYGRGREGDATVHKREQANPQRIDVSGPSPAITQCASKSAIPFPWLLAATLRI